MFSIPTISKRRKRPLTQVFLPFGGLFRNLQQRIRHLNSKCDVKFAILIDLFMNSWEAVHRPPGSVEPQAPKHWKLISIGGAKEGLGCNSSDAMVIRVMVMTALWHRSRNCAYTCSISSEQKEPPGNKTATVPTMLVVWLLPSLSNK